MPAIDLDVRDMLAGEERETSELVVLAGTTTFRMEGSIPLQDLVNPSTQCEGGFKRLTPSGWIVDMRWTFVGGPFVTGQPFIQLDRGLSEMTGHTVKGYIKAITAGQYGGMCQVT